MIPQYNHILVITALKKKNIEPLFSAYMAEIFSNEWNSKSMWRVWKITLRKRNQAFGLILKSSDLLKIQRSWLWTELQRNIWLVKTDENHCFHLILPLLVLQAGPSLSALSFIQSRGAAPTKRSLLLYYTCTTWFLLVSYLSPNSLLS